MPSTSPSTSSEHESPHEDRRSTEEYTNISPCIVRQPYTNLNSNKTNASGKQTNVKVKDFPGYDATNALPAQRVVYAEEFPVMIN